MSSFVRPDLAGSQPLRDTAHDPKRSWRTWLFGRPLSTADAEHEAIGKTVGLAVFASDALSSTAYATQEILIILAVAGAAAFVHAFPIAVAIVILLALVTLSYEQTIHAYPGGGGAYIVSRDNLGELPAQIAAAALLTDYILTVAVSVSSGVAQIASAFPIFLGHRVGLAVVCVVLIMVVNLRGVRESGAVFAVPTYFFIAMMFLTVGVAFAKRFTGGLGMVVDPPPVHGEGAAVTLFLLLHAFSSGTTALTGVEAISNGITAFKAPRSRNAGLTLIVMAVILGALFLGITWLTVHIGATPSEEETVISQLARTAFGGRGVLYLGTIAATTLILIMAANTAFADFPRLAALQAGDGFLPRQLTYRGSRLVFSRGIVVLALVASLLIWAFDASVTGLIPLYAIGVFLSFTLSQAGMVRRWWKIGHLAPGEERKERGSVLRHERGWVTKTLVNGLGALMTAVVTLVFAVTKFHDGAWFVIVVIPLLVFVFFRIHAHYRFMAERLSLEDFGAPGVRIGRHRVILPISGVHRGTVQALRYARALSDDVTAVYVSADAAAMETVERKWGQWGSGVRLVILSSPYRLLLEPLLAYIQEVADQRQPNEVITIVVPQFVPHKRWHELLHAQTAVLLRLALLFRPGIVITNVPYHVASAQGEDLA
jgi:amino acid transporter